MNRLNTVAAHVAPTLTITDNRSGKKIDVKVKDGTIRATDLKQLGIQTYDPGYMNTTCCVSRISFIDGNRGVLRYRGYPIEQLAQDGSFTEVAFLLQYGELPTRGQLTQWEQDLMRHSMLHQDVATLTSAFRYDAHPMGMFVSAMAALGTLHPETNPALTSQNIYKDKAVRNKEIARILGSATTLAAMAYRHRMGRPFNTPNSDLGYTENFLYMLDVSHEGTSYRPHPKLVKALDVLFVLHAEHELNCSTSAMRHLTSSNVDVYTACAAAAGALYGPRHGGANEAVLRMLERIGSIENVPTFVEKVKQRKELLMGFGHRVYKHYDPRATIVRKIAEDVFEICGREPLIEVAMELERIALSDPYFKDRKLYPNVDFYSGLIYKAMGFPTDMFPILFTVPRLAGWLAHWSEWIDDPENRIYRPFQVYKGYDKRDYVQVDERSEKVHSKELTVKRSAFNRRRDASLQSAAADRSEYEWIKD
ncbi:hypothetical protein FOZ60_002435 [Perkinsus olseni]|uniref:Citrate synthase n=3 Tax=Perkinsus olseni TaxID=32597 RepID=A0A7J6NY21_PEROL|nr:hypothetical protein FOZ60_002435 [Perkinsus olseni]